MKKPYKKVKECVQGLAARNTKKSIRKRKERTGPKAVRSIEKEKIGNGRNRKRKKNVKKKDTGSDLYLNAFII